jgi:hypothetical protein
MTTLLARNVVNNTLDLLSVNLNGLVTTDTAAKTELENLNLQVANVTNDNLGVLSLKTHLLSQESDLNVTVSNYPASQTVNVDNFPTTQSVTMSLNKSGSIGNLSNAQVVTTPTVSTTVDCSAYKTGKILLTGSNNANTNNIVVEVSDNNSDWYRTSEMITNGSASDRWSSQDVDISTVTHLRLQYTDNETVTATLLMGS